MVMHAINLWVTFIISCSLAAGIKWEKNYDKQESRMSKIKRIHVVDEKERKIVRKTQRSKEKIKKNWKERRNWENNKVPFCEKQRRNNNRRHMIYKGKFYWSVQRTSDVMSRKNFVRYWARMRVSLCTDHVSTETKKSLSVKMEHCSTLGKIIAAFILAKKSSNIANRWWIRVSLRLPLILQ